MEPRPISYLIPEHLNRINQSQQWLADKIGMPKQQLSDYINMRHVMGLIVYKKVATALKIVIDDIYEWEWQQE